MKTPSARFQVGSYRPIYLWGGPGTIRMNRLKFMDVPVDEFAHHEVHGPEGAHRVIHMMIYTSWIFWKEFCPLEADVFTNGWLHRKNYA